MKDTGFRIQDTRKNIMHRASCIVHLDNEKGIALVMTLVISAIALAIMAGLIYMITAGTQISGIQKRYKTALEAGMGGTEVAYEYIGARGDPGISGINFLFSPLITAACRNLKLNQSTSNWAIGTTCPANSNSMAINPADNTTYDWRFELGASPFPTYRVYTKIVDTVEGNSGGDIGLVKGGVVSSGVGEVTVQSKPYLYTIEIDAQDAANPAERAKLSVLYQY
ncbi:MAG: hypothetical protein KJ739_01620 [Nitrospinae bacterium]|nr:hypothetical protein [Nitrospinota bacterium]